MASPYKRRKSSLIRNLWIYRYVVVVAVILGLLLWFVWANNEPVTVHFPFGLGTLASTSGVIILLSALAGSIITMLVLGVLVGLRRLKAGAAPVDEENSASLPDDRPPSDYASKTPEGFPDAKWSRPD